MSTQGVSDSVQEWFRLRALARYFAPNNITADVVNAQRSQPLPPSLASSPLLTAITQNGALRMNCDRAYVSLIDSSTQHILSEATRSISVRDSTNYADPQDALFLGVQSLNKEYGICPQSVAIFTDRTGRLATSTHDLVANATRYVIRDLRQLDQYKDCPYVVGFPHFVSYAEVPVKSASGHILGTYCIIDNKIRHDFFDDKTIDILNDVAACISEQFELHAVKQESVRGVQMMKGLSAFIESRRSRRDSNGGTSRRVSLNNQIDLAGHHQGLAFQPEVTSLSCPLVSETQNPDDTLMHDITPPTSPFDVSSLSNPGFPLHSMEKPADTPLSAGQTLKDVYSGAAHLIRAAMDIEGLMFLRGSAENSLSAFANSPLDPKLPADYNPYIRASSSVCEALGSSVAPGGYNLGSSQQPLPINDTSLNYLIRHFPRGCVFVADTQGNPMFEKEGAFIAQTYGPQASSTVAEVSDELQSLIRKARSLIFLPLWDTTEDRLIVGMLGWSSDPTRVIGEQDMTCLSAFGNTFMTEIARAEMTELARAKSDFLSSISHELRSPLHGIHAAVDLLQDPETGSKAELVEMIQSCSSTLLDTLNHVLDYSKVNKLTDEEPHAQTLSCGERRELGQNAFGDSTSEYLCGLVLAVVEGLHFGQASRKAAFNKLQSTPRDQSAGPDFFLGSALVVDGASHTSPVVPAAENVAVYVDIESRADWCMMLCAGAWKRLVMNLFANALKYTDEGFIEVSLGMITDPKNPIKRTAHLVISDTGIGMSPDFLQRSLYQPFVQENPIADGTGLGLSIVKKIVQDLQGTIDVQSTQGVGTRFDVLVPVPDHDDLDNLTPIYGGDMLDPNALLKGRSICLFSPQKDPDSDLSPAKIDLQMRRTEALHSCVRSIAQNWFDMKVITCDKLEDNNNADIIIAEESQVASLLVADPDLSRRLSERRLVLVDVNPGKKFWSNAVNLAYPISPRALVRALSTSLTEPQPSSLDNNVTSIPTPLPQVTSSFSPELEPSPKKIKKNTTITTDPVELAEDDAGSGKDEQHFLLVDDNAINLRLLSTFMKKLGFSAETAVNGLEAFEKFKASSKFTTVLMDISMPVMNGFESSRAIRSHEALQGQLKPARIIALTGLGSEASKQEAKMSGIDEFYTKPVKFGALKELLQR